MHTREYLRQAQPLALLTVSTTAKEALLKDSRWKIYDSLLGQVMVIVPRNVARQQKHVISEIHYYLRRYITNDRLVSRSYRLRRCIERIASYILLPRIDTVIKYLGCRKTGANFRSLQKKKLSSTDMCLIKILRSASVYSAHIIVVRKQKHDHGQTQISYFGMIVYTAHLRDTFL